MSGLFLGLGCIFLVVSLAGGLLTLGYQFLRFLRYGGWEPVKATDFCANQMGIAWCAYPQDWHGLHRLLDAVSPGVAGVVIGLVFVGVGLALDSAERKP